MMSKKAHSFYDLTSSPLFRMLGKGQLERAIGVSWSQGTRLLHPRFYRVWTTVKGREIQRPMYELEVVHKRIAKLLSRIMTPEYVYSKRGVSYVDNADQHRGAEPLIKTDVNKFYPSTSWSMVYRMFLERFECAQDIAARLADLCCFRKMHLPTGSALSGYVAFFAVQPLFDRINAICKSAGCKMTLFVDDLTASGVGASKKVLSEIRAAVRYFGLSTRDEKSRTYAPMQAKEITGAVVIGERLLLPNKQHLKMWHAKRLLATAAKGDRVEAEKRLLGHQQQAKQILDRANRR